MTTAERAFEVFKSVGELNLPCLLERRKEGAAGDPATYAVCVKAKNFTGRELHELLKLVQAEGDLDIGIVVNENSPYLVLK